MAAVELMPDSRPKAAQIAIVALCAAAVWLAYQVPLPNLKSSRQVSVELLPIEETTPSWNGSYPVLTVQFSDTNPEHYRFKSSVAIVKPTVRHESPVNQFEVDLHSGLFVLRQTDLFVSDTMPLLLTRTYRPWDYGVRAFGVGTNHPYDICPTGTRLPYTYMNLNLEDDRPIHFPRISKGTGYADAVFRHGETSSEFYDARIAWNGDGWTLDFRDGRRFLFPEAYYSKSYAQGAPTEMRDEHGNRIELKRDKVRNLERLVSPGGRAINFYYDESNRIVEAWDDVGNVRKYSYDATGHLETVSDGERMLYRFRYEPLLHERGYDPFLMTRVENGEGKMILRNEYKNGRVSAQVFADGEVFRYEYLFDRHWRVLEATVTLPGGRQRRFFFKNEIPVSGR